MSFLHPMALVPFVSAKYLVPLWVAVVVYMLLFLVGPGRSSTTTPVLLCCHIDLNISLKRFCFPCPLHFLTCAGYCQGVPCATLFASVHHFVHSWYFMVLLQHLSFNNIISFYFLHVIKADFMPFVLLLMIIYWWSVLSVTCHTLWICMPLLWFWGYPCIFYADLYFFYAFVVF